MRQYLYFFTSKSVSICTLVLVNSTFRWDLGCHMCRLSGLSGLCHMWQLSGLWVANVPDLWPQLRQWGVQWCTSVRTNTIWRIDSYKLQILPHLAARQEHPEMTAYLYFCTTSVFVLLYYYVSICTFVLRQYLYFYTTWVSVLLQYIGMCTFVLLSVFVLVYYVRQYLYLCTTSDSALAYVSAV